MLDLLLPANLREKDELMLSSLLVQTGNDIEKPTSLLPAACTPDQPFGLVEVTVDNFDGTSSPYQPATGPQDDTTSLPLDPSPLGQVSINLDSPASDDSEPNLSGVEEPPPSPIRELASFEKEVDASSEEHMRAQDEVETESLNEEQDAKTIDTKVEDTVFELTVENGDVRERELDDNESETMSGEGIPVPANEATIRLARQISQGHKDSLSSSLGSPTEEKPPSLLQPSLEEEEVAVDECILSAWLPGLWVRGVLSSGRKVAPEHLARPGLITLTGKVSQLLLTCYLRE